MAAQRKPEQREAVSQKTQRDSSLVPGLQPSDAQASKSPALALQAELHRRLSPRQLEMMSRYVTLFLALSIAGTWFVTGTGSQTL